MRARNAVFDSARLALVIATSALLVACAETHYVGERARGGVEYAGEAVSDTSLKLAIKSRLADDPDVKSRLIQIDVKDGMVRLGGVQPTYEGKSRAVEVTRATKGVIRVDDQIVVDRPMDH